MTRKQNFIKNYLFVWQDEPYKSKLGITAKTLYGFLANYIRLNTNNPKFKDQYGVFCHPSQEELGDLIGCSTKTIGRSIQELKNIGLIRVLETIESNGKKVKRFNRYYLEILKGNVEVVDRKVVTQEQTLLQSVAGTDDTDEPDWFNEPATPTP